MRRWGILVTAFYFLLLVFLLIPGALVLIYEAGSRGIEEPIRKVLETLFDSDGFADQGGWLWWSWLAVLITAQTLLLFVSVDTSRKRLRPRVRVQLSVAAITLAVGLLTFAAAWSVVVAIWGDDGLDFSSLWIISPVTFWVLWGIVFYLHGEQVSARLDRAVNWLMAGSVLELLVVVPCHVIVRQRDDCSAPGVTAFGISTGIAVMLMAFGPSVFFLYQERLRRYRNAAPERKA